MRRQALKALGLLDYRRKLPLVFKLQIFDAGANGQTLKFLTVVDA